MYKTIAVVLIALAISGCAFNKQAVEFEPRVNTLVSNVGQGITVSVRVVDERSDSALGHRGTAYGKAAAITTSQDLERLIGDVVVESLRRRGFAVVPYDAGAQPRLTVKLRLLEYSTSTGFWTGGVHLKGALVADAANSATGYERIYREEIERRVAVVPTAETNAQWMNELLNALLTKMLEDQELERFLAGTG